MQSGRVIPGPTFPRASPAFFLLCTAGPLKRALIESVMEDALDFEAQVSVRTTGLSCRSLHRFQWKRGGVQRRLLGTGGVSISVVSAVAGGDFQETSNDGLDDELSVGLGISMKVKATVPDDVASCGSQLPHRAVH